MTGQLGDLAAKEREITMMVVYTVVSSLEVPKPCVVPNVKQHRAV